MRTRRRHEQRHHCVNREGVPLPAADTDTGTLSHVIRSEWRKFRTLRSSWTVLVAAAERARISRETHDIVAHTLSAMVALSDGAAIAAERDVNAAQDAMRNSATLGRQALLDLRQLLSGLRADDEVDLAPTPGVTDLEDPLASVRTAGLSVELVMTGHVPPMSPGLELALYRIVQESLADVLKHAHGATRAVVTLRFTARRLRGHRRERRFIDRRRDEPPITGTRPQRDAGARPRLRRRHRGGTPSRPRPAGVVCAGSW